jgi:hypothetical protein
MTTSDDTGLVETACLNAMMIAVKLADCCDVV